MLFRRFHNIVITDWDISDISLTFHQHTTVIQHLRTVWKCLKTHTKGQIVTLQKIGDLRSILQFALSQSRQSDSSNTLLTAIINMSLVSAVFIIIEEYFINGKSILIRKKWILRYFCNGNVSNPFNIKLNQT